MEALNDIIEFDFEKLAKIRNQTIMIHEVNISSNDEIVSQLRWMHNALRTETLDAELIRSQIHLQRFLIKTKFVVAINAGKHHVFES